MRKVLSETEHRGMKNCDVSANIQALPQRVGSSLVVTPVLFPLTMCWGSWGAVPTSPHCYGCQICSAGGGKLQVWETVGWVVPPRLSSRGVCGGSSTGAAASPCRVMKWGLRLGDQCWGSKGWVTPAREWGSPDTGLDGTGYQPP